MSTQTSQTATKTKVLADLYDNDTVTVNLGAPFKSFAVEVNNLGSAILVKFFTRFLHAYVDEEKNWTRFTKAKKPFVKKKIDEADWSRVPDAIKARAQIHLLFDAELDFIVGVTRDGEAVDTKTFREYCEGDDNFRFQVFTKVFTELLNNKKDQDDDEEDEDSGND